MSRKTQLKRRRFLKLSALVFTATPFMSFVRTRDSEKSICIYSKNFQWLEYADLGKLMGEVGFDGINITVRNGGHVAPYDVERKLPEAIQAVQRFGVQVPIITTDILDAEDPLTEPILKTASELGVKYYRMGHYRYNGIQPIDQQIERIKEKMTKLAALNEKYQIKGNYQNVSGDEFGGSVWDVWYVLKDFQSQWIGVQFDLRNAIAEGEHSWVNDLNLVGKMVQSVVIRDFKWENSGNNSIYAKDVPIGDGIVDFSTYFKSYKGMNSDGPITIQMDYPLFNGQEDQLLEKEKVNIAKTELVKALRNLKNYLTSEGIR